MNFLEHIFGTRNVELGLDWIQLLIQKQKLPMLFIAGEPQSGKSTFCHWVWISLTQTDTVWTMEGLLDVFKTPNAVYEKLNGRCVIVEEVVSDAIFLELVKAVFHAKEVMHKGESKAFFCNFILTGQNCPEEIMNDTRFLILDLEKAKQADAETQIRLHEESCEFEDFLKERTLSSEKWFDHVRTTKEHFMKHTMVNLTIENFIACFDYGDENSGELLFDRFQKDSKGDIENFYDSLCEIDRMKFDKYFLATQTPSTNEL